jgi:hypothetical protein
MGNQKPLQPGEDLSGSVSGDWDEWVASHRDTLSNSNEESLLLAKYIFYYGYLACYNRMTIAMQRSPITLVNATTEVRTELNDYFSKL